MMAVMTIEAETRPGRDIYTVSRLTRAVRGLLEGTFPLLWIEGELTGVSRPASGHIYFALKDDRSQIRCAMFRGRNKNLSFTPENGMQVLVRGRVGLYEARGDFQLVAEQMEPAGDGALRRAFEEMKARLQQEGLFDDDRKIAVPTHPATIGIVTSPTGAAIHDILTVLRRRSPATRVIVYPTLVQGNDAAAAIAAAIRMADQRKECDAVLVTRGGGSLEDLWAFNEEVTARAIAGCELPVVSAVGHEIDFTIADFVADLRAATPSAAAELLSPDRTELANHIHTLHGRMQAVIHGALAQAEQKTGWLLRQLRQLHPGNRLDQHMQRLDELQDRLTTAMNHGVRHRRSELATVTAHLHQHTPVQRIETLNARHSALRDRLYRAVSVRLNHFESTLGTLIRALDTVSPLATLDRGYAIVKSPDSNTILRKATSVRPGDVVNARLSDGSLKCTVDEVLGESTDEAT